MLSDHQPIQTESKHQPSYQPDKPAKKSWFNQGWIWLIVAAVGIGVVYFGLSDVTKQMTGINYSIQDNTQAIRAQSGILTQINHGIHQLIYTVKDSADKIIQKM